MSSRGFLGILLIIIGSCFLLNYYGLFDFSIWWPSLIIIIGLYQLFRNRFALPGLILTVIGVFIQLHKFDLFPGDIILPVILILIGLSIIFSKTKAVSSKPLSAKVKDEDHFDYLALFSGVETRHHSTDFKGGSVTAVFGGAVIDLRDAVLSEKGAEIEVNAVFGGVDIIVPDDWVVHVKGTPLFGGWENKTRHSESEKTNKPEVNVKCLAVFGGVDIKN